MALPAHAALAAVLLVLHFFLRPVLVGWPGAPDLLLGGLLLAALHLRAGYAALLGTVLGLLEGAMALQGPGSLMIVYALAGYAASRCRDLLFSDARTFLFLYVAIGVWATQVGLALFGPPVLDLRLAAFEAPLSALATAVICWSGERMLSYLVVR